MLPETSYEARRLAVLRHACESGQSRARLSFRQGGVQITWPPSGALLALGGLLALLLALLGMAVSR